MKPPLNAIGWHQGCWRGSFPMRFPSQKLALRAEEAGVVDTA
jgi:hypothetical protein